MIPPDYSSVLSVPDADDADQWGWDWSPGDKPLRIRKRAR
jgi:hypothetical protein